MPEYRSSERIYKSIIEYEKLNPFGLNGFLLLLHIGTHPDREDNFYQRLDELIDHLRSLGYEFSRVNEMLTDCGSYDRAGKIASLEGEGNGETELFKASFILWGFTPGHTP
jgi:hypothetical protein